MIELPLWIVGVCIVGGLSAINIVSIYLHYTYFKRLKQSRETIESQWKKFEAEMNDGQRHLLNAGKIVQGSLDQVFRAIDKTEQQSKRITKFMELLCELAESLENGKSNNDRKAIATNAVTLENGSTLAWKPSPEERIQSLEERIRSREV